MDILIYAKPEIIEHKMRDRMDDSLKDKCFCYWTVGKSPAIVKCRKIKLVKFTDGKEIYAWGKFIGTIGRYKGKSPVIRFMPLIRVREKLPKKAPIRGWCYI